MEKDLLLTKKTPFGVIGKTQSPIHNHQQKNNYQDTNAWLLVIEICLIIVTCILLLILIFFE